jgi:peroxiredoxin family protein
MSTAPATAATLEQRVAELERRLAGVEDRTPEDRVTLVVFSGDLDRVIAAYVIATGAAALGQQVSMFFTFWGLSALKQRRTFDRKHVFERMMAMMTPDGSRSLPVSKLNYFGIGAKMLRTMMQNNNVASLEDMMRMTRDMGARIIACEMSREVMGIEDAELIEGPECGGVAAFLADALQSRATLFI